MKLLLTNDDGVDARGLAALREAVDGVAEAIVMAPAAAASGCSHSATTDRPFRIVSLTEDRHAVEGTPADCVRVAIHRFGKDIHWVVAGINDGGNLGLDVYYSGTVAAAREAVLHGIPGIAVSHYHNHPLTEKDWQRAVRWTQPLLAELMKRPWKPGTFWNINLPHLDAETEAPEIVFCPLDPSPLPLSYLDEQNTIRYNGTYRQRKRIQGADVEVCFSGKIAVTEVSVVERSR